MEPNRRGKLLTNKGDKQGVAKKIEGIKTKKIRSKQRNHTVGPCRGLASGNHRIGGGGW